MDVSLLSVASVVSLAEVVKGSLQSSTIMDSDVLCVPDTSVEVSSHRDVSDETLVGHGVAAGDLSSPTVMGLEGSVNARGEISSCGSSEGESSKVLVMESFRRLDDGELDSYLSLSGKDASLDNVK